MINAIGRRATRAAKPDAAIEAAWVAALNAQTEAREAPLRPIDFNGHVPDGNAEAAS